ncbi:hypothetical protein DPMN_106054 [Dreissena polymorpha]|uniref:Uncharacterized protein n=1 Tax=Dreissena polymorpha TaxID=45954 RepID=A0A9D4K4F4_DREPO|nr:hypothetical protein DPMN_106054 [Dreissena polymorpha]
MHTLKKKLWKWLTQEALLSIQGKKYPTKSQISVSNKQVHVQFEIRPDSTYYINFMTDSGKRKGCFRWPAKENKGCL